MNKAMGERRLFHTLPLPACVWLVLLGPSAQAAPPAPAEPWLAGAALTRQKVLNELAPKAKQPPYDKVLILLTRTQKELALPDPDAKRAAIDDAYDAALLVQTKTDDPALTARLFDGFLMPALPFARTDPTFYDSRRQLLKAAFGAYQKAGQEDRQLAALRLMQKEAGDDENFSDWVNLQFASLYAHRGQYEPAMDALGAVKSPGMMGSTAFLPAMQQKMEEEKQQAEDKPLVKKAVHPKITRIKHLVKHSTTHKV